MIREPISQNQPHAKVAMAQESKEVDVDVGEEVERAEEERPLTFALIRRAVQISQEEQEPREGAARVDDAEELMERRVLRLGWLGITRIANLEPFTSCA